MVCRQSRRSQRSRRSTVIRAAARSLGGSASSPDPNFKHGRPCKTVRPWERQLPRWLRPAYLRADKRQPHDNLIDDKPRRAPARSRQPCSSLSRGSGATMGGSILRHDPLFSRAAASQGSVGVWAKRGWSSMRFPRWLGRNGTCLKMSLQDNERATDEGLLASGVHIFSGAPTSSLALLKR